MSNEHDVIKMKSIFKFDYNIKEGNCYHKLLKLNNGSKIWGDT